MTTLVNGYGIPASRLRFGYGSQSLGRG
ncbi:hypothetical protein GMOD_00002448 [Pyrenophora seminiperda CCB06]|uniref:Uncharacterized protein n=1 Tax=Pyrenophora seminiperda CCB06 TaxID=1302712 RepID=A0A3M7M2Q7_9PLEO|nr:hypothetical protein GMOD_00002448 [Pyrenophora seminiperda CCB06]